MTHTERSANRRAPKFAAEHMARSEGGSALLIALMVMGLMSVVLAALVSFANTSQGTIEGTRERRVDRYAADGAIKGAINWARDQHATAVDPDLATPNSANPCVYRYEGLTVSCAADAGSGSGAPTDVGLVPPEALLMLGERHNQTGPYNVARCRGLIDAAGNWVTNAFNGFVGSSGDLNVVGFPESSALFQTQRQDDFWSCGQRSRSYEDFTVEGKLAAAGNMVAASNTRLTAVQANSTSLLAGGTVARMCSGDIRPACSTPGNRSDGSRETSDPARADPNNPAQNPTDIRASWEPLPIAGLQPQSQAYFLNADGTLTPTSSCAGADRTIVFQPGWYRNASFLNGFTANPGCTDVTFWFAPDAGLDGQLLTADDRPGAFLMDFRQGPASSCNGSFDKASRWCIGGSNAQSPRVVVGTPDGWSPVNPSGGGSSSVGRMPVQIGTAGTVDSNLSVRWRNAANSNAVTNAAAIDGSVVTYTPCNVFGLFNCPSSDRAIRLRNFTTEASGPPVSESGHPAGRLFVTVAYGMQNGSSLNPALVIEAVSNESGRRSCGTYALPRLTYSGSGAVPTATLTNQQAEQLAAACGSVDLINGLEIKFQATGNTWNSGDPRIFLDGARIHFETFSGASFPRVDPVASDGAAARSDCDPSAPGGQLIFTGESHVYVADGSLEVCAGPYPSDPQNHQSIGLWAVPAVAPIRPASVSNNGGNNASVNYTGTAGAARLAIGEPGGRQDVSVSYRGAEWDYIEGRIGVTMSAYQPPPGFQIKKVNLRISYNTNNSCFLWCSGSEESMLEVPSWGEITLPRNPSAIQYANNTVLELYDSAAGADKIGLSALAAGSQSFVFKARANCIVWVCSDSTDQLEGLELDITLEPTAANANTPMLIPQSGCTVAYPNYESGSSGPDCAVIKGDARQSTEVYNVPFTSNREGYWAGRFSIKGTIYAPSSAVEVDDGDNAYPIATRGVVVRHLRVSGWKYRPGYQGTPISNNIDRTPAPREATFTACTQSPTRVQANAVCDESAGDVPVAAARVRFAVSGGVASVPEVVWWSTDV